MSVYPDSDKVSGPEGILLGSSAVGYWHGEGTAGPSEPVEIVREPEQSPPQPAVNSFREEATELGPLLGAAQLDGTVVDLEPGEGSDAYHYVFGREQWLLVLAGTPTLRHPEGEDRLEAGDLVCFPEGPAGDRRSIAASRRCVRCSCRRRVCRPTSTTRTPTAGCSETGPAEKVRGLARRKSASAAEPVEPATASEPRNGPTQLQGS